MAVKIDPYTGTKEINRDRAGWAEEAVDAFQMVCHTDDEDAVADLLCNLFHYCDQTGQDPRSQLHRALSAYQAEGGEDLI